MEHYKEILIQHLNHQILEEKNIQLSIARIDLTHPQVSGNKWFKLKYNLEEAQKQGKDTLLSFGGAYSNHIYALASAGKRYGFKTIAIIRGEEHLPLNNTLDFVQKSGTKIFYLDRSTYREKQSEKVISFLQEKFGDFYLVPEGGSNAWAVKGCAEILPRLPEKYDYVCTPCGTGGTLAGLLAGNPYESEILGFSALKGGTFLREDILNLLQDYEITFDTWISHKNFQLFTEYHFGGYAKTKPELLNFIKDFVAKYAIETEPIYTGKMFYAIFDLLEKGYFKENTRVLALHTGGLRGNEIK